MLGNAGQSPSSSFFNAWVEFFKAVDEGIESTAINHCFGEVGGMLGDTPEDIGCCFFVEPVLFGEGVDQLR